jgi:hypothetical protein
MRGAHETLGLFLALVLLGTGCATTGSPPLAWDALPFPRNSDWPGPKGLPAHVNNGDLILQGQSVRTRAVYAMPLIIECKVELENRLASDGSFAIGFVPADSPRDVDPVNIRQFRLIYRNPGAYSGQDGLVLEGRDNASGGETLWGEEPFVLEAGKPYVVRLEITTEHLLVVINGRAYDLKDVKIPYNRFYVQLGSWQPVNRWHVRNFVVR